MLEYEEFCHKCKGTGKDKDKNVCVICNGTGIKIMFGTKKNYI